MEGPAREEIGWIGLVFSGGSQEKEKKQGETVHHLPSESSPLC